MELCLQSYSFAHQNGLLFYMSHRCLGSLPVWRQVPKHRLQAYPTYFSTTMLYFVMKWPQWRQNQLLFNHQVHIFPLQHLHSMLPLIPACQRPLPPFLLTKVDVILWGTIQSTHSIRTWVGVTQETRIVWNTLCRMGLLNHINRWSWSECRLIHSVHRKKDWTRPNVVYILSS